MLTDWQVLLYKLPPLYSVNFTFFIWSRRVFIFVCLIFPSQRVEHHQEANHGIVLWNHNCTLKSYNAKIDWNKLAAGCKYNSMYGLISIHFSHKWLNRCLPFVAISILLYERLFQNYYTKIQIMNFVKKRNTTDTDDKNNLKFKKSRRK